MIADGRGRARHFSRYVAVGAVATAAHYTLLVAAVELARWPPWLAAGAGAVLGAQVAYAGNRWYTFAHRGRWLPSWLRFQVTAAAGAALNMGVVAVAVFAGCHYLVGQIAATASVLVVTYVVNRRWTFAATPDPD